MSLQRHGHDLLFTSYFSSFSLADHKLKKCHHLWNNSSHINCSSSVFRRRIKRSKRVWHGAARAVRTRGDLMRTWSVRSSENRLLGIFPLVLAKPRARARPTSLQKFHSLVGPIKEANFRARERVGSGCTRPPRSRVI